MFPMRLFWGFLPGFFYWFSLIFIRNAWISFIVSFQESFRDFFILRYFFRVSSRIFSEIPLEVLPGVPLWIPSGFLRGFHLGCVPGFPSWIPGFLCILCFSGIPPEVLLVIHSKVHSGIHTFIVFFRDSSRDFLRTELHLRTLIISTGIPGGLFQRFLAWIFFPSTIHSLSGIPSKILH